MQRHSMPMRFSSSFSEKFVTNVFLFLVYDQLSLFPRVYAATAYVCVGTLRVLGIEQKKERISPSHPLQCRFKFVVATKTLSQIAVK